MWLAGSGTRMVLLGHKASLAHNLANKTVPRLPPSLLDEKSHLEVLCLHRKMASINCMALILQMGIFHILFVRRKVSWQVATMMLTIWGRSAKLDLEWTPELNAVQPVYSFTIHNFTAKPIIRRF